MGFIQAARQFQSIVGSGINFPSTHEARWLCDQVRYSPDLGYLEQKEWQLLFAVEDFKRSHSRYSLIEDSVFVATAYSTRKFNYWVLEAGDERTPIPMENFEEKAEQTIRYFPQPLKVKGELHLIRTHQFLGLDTFKMNTVQFRRKRVNVILPYREQGIILNQDAEGRELPIALQGKKFFLSPEKVFVIRAWMYVGNPKYWDHLLDAGWRGFKPVNCYESRRPWLREYYDYPKRSLESDRQRAVS